MGRLGRSWKLAQASWKVVNADRELIGIPVISFMVSLIVGGMAALFIWATGTSNVDIGSGGIDIDAEAATESQMLFEPSAAGYVVGVLAAIALSIISVYFTAALVAGSLDRLRGGDPTVGSALSAATKRLPVLVPFAILAATVGLVLRAVQERLGFLGALLGGLLDMAWAVVTFLVVPILVVEETGPIDSVKRSVTLFKTTWGENLAGQIGLSAVGFVASLPLIVPLGIGFLSGSSVILAVMIALSVVWIALVAATMTALSAAYRSALYLYATSGTVPAGFESVGFSDAFAPKS